MLCQHCDSYWAGYRAAMKIARAGLFGFVIGFTCGAVALFFASA